MPDYVHSQKGRSYVTNAAVHTSNEPALKTDISGFFANTRDDTVYRFFREVMHCSPDVARILTNLLCYDGHVATGSPVSNELAFFANQPVMDTIYDYAMKQQCRMTLLVDDITLTGPAASRKMLNQVKMMLRSANHRVSSKMHKTRTYGVGQTKHITGIVIYEGQNKLPNCRHKNLLHAYLAHKSLITKRQLRTAKDKFRGHLAEAMNVDPSGISAKFTQRPRPRRRVSTQVFLKKAA